MNDINKDNNMVFSIDDIKQELIRGYEKIDTGLLQKIQIVWKTDKTMTTVLKKKIDMEYITSRIVGADYIFTDIDLWILATAKNLPIVLFSVYGLKQLFHSGTGFGETSWGKMLWLVLSGDIQKGFYFVRSPAPSTYTVPNYSIITKTNGSLFSIPQELLDEGIEKETIPLTEFLAKPI